jgi:Arc/MetJ-type ribon-helix-helix transcriptional regulator
LTRKIPGEKERPPGLKCYGECTSFSEGGIAVKSVTVDLPEKLAEELSRLVETGWFPDEGEAVRAALAEFLRHRAAPLQERFQREDIEWALRAKQNAQP